MELTARVGYAARGLVYVMVGGLAVLAAIGWGGKTGGSKSALVALLGEPFGWVLVGILALGLAGFAIWRFVEALSDADRRGNDAKGLAIRGAHLVSGVIYVGLAASAVGMVLGYRSSGDDGAKDWTAWLMAQPFGRWLIAAVGLAVIGGGLAFLWKGVFGNVADKLAVPGAHRGWAVALGRAGFTARGVVFGLVGLFLILAAWNANSSQAEGLGGALDALRRQPFGAVLLGIVAAGLAAFGAFGLVQAWYRRLDPPDAADMMGSAKDFGRAARDRMPG